MAKAEKGDLIRVVKATGSFGEYKNGDILEVYKRSNDGEGVFVMKVNAGGSLFLYDHEYEIFRKAGEENAPTCKHCGKTGVHTCRGPKGDAVNHPNHYTQGRFETIEIIEEITKGYSDGYVAYCVGNALKYLARAPFKHEEPTEDLRKASKYLAFAIEYLDEKSTQD